MPPWRHLSRQNCIFTWKCIFWARCRAAWRAGRVARSALTHPNASLLSFHLCQHKKVLFLPARSSEQLNLPILLLSQGNSNLFIYIFLVLSSAQGDLSFADCTWSEEAFTFCSATVTHRVRGDQFPSGSKWLSYVKKDREEQREIWKRG